MSNKPLIIVLSGLPATGKSTIGQHLSSELKIPYFSKDSFKELAFDCLGTIDREWSKKLGRFSYELLYFTCKEIMKSKQPFIIESNFTSKSENELTRLSTDFDYAILQIHCRTEGNVLFLRFKDRAINGSRHAGHCDAENLKEFEHTLTHAPQKALEIAGPLITVDTTDWEKINLKYIEDKVTKLYNFNKASQI